MSQDPYLPPGVSQADIDDPVTRQHIERLYPTSTLRRIEQRLNDPYESLPLTRWPLQAGNKGETMSFREAAEIDCSAAVACVRKFSLFFLTELVMGDDGVPNRLGGAFESKWREFWEINGPRHPESKYDDPDVPF